MPWPSELLARCCDLWHQRASPHLPQSCRYTPTCSVYAAEALRRYGLWRGGRIAWARMRRCRPGSPRGDDPVP